MQDLKLLDIKPWGNVTNIFEWESPEIQFYNGRVQKNRKRIHFLRKIQFIASGTYKTWEYLKEFYDYHHGLLDLFLFEYDGEVLMCRFADKINIIQKREQAAVEGFDIVGFEAQVTLAVDSRNVLYEEPPKIKRFDLPIRGKIEDEVDWNTHILDMNVQGREMTWRYPIHKFSFTLSGGKELRNRLIKMYNMYGDFVPLEFTANENFYTCFLPPSIEITDFREINEIIGFECKMTLTSINDFHDILGLKYPVGFVVGSIEEFSIRNPMAFVVGDYSRLSFEKPMAFIVGELPSRIGISDSTIITILGKENITG